MKPFKLNRIAYLEEAEKGFQNFYEFKGPGDFRKEIVDILRPYIGENFTYELDRPRFKEGDYMAHMLARDTDEQQKSIIPCTLIIYNSNYTDASMGVRYTKGKGTDTIVSRLKANEVLTIDIDNKFIKFYSPSRKSTS